MNKRLASQIELDAITLFGVLGGASLAASSSG
jgi:hypothetical protein